MMGEVVSLWRLEEDRGEKDLAGDSPRLGSTDNCGANGFSGDRMVSAWKNIS